MTILAGTQTAEFKGNPAKIAFGSMVAANLYSDPALVEAVTVQVAPRDDPAGADYMGLRAVGAAADFAATAGKSLCMPDFVAEALRLQAGVNVAADRVFTLVIQMSGDFVS